MELPSLILLNGPPRSGKDFAGNILERLLLERGRNVTVDKFARIVKERCHAAYRLFEDDGLPLSHDYFEVVKDEPQPAFLGRTPRECYIAFSEWLMKPLHGEHVFGRMLRDSLDTVDPTNETVIVTDSGFAAEAWPMIDVFGRSSSLLVRLFREGCTFAGDSRSYIELAGVRTVEVVNPGNPNGFERVLISALGGGS